MPLCKLPSGIQIAYDEAGSGPPLLLLHAFPLDRTMWEPQLAALSDVARVIAPDLPGFGESPAATFSIEGVADVVAEFLTELKIPKSVVCGLSMGGYIALAFARKHADKLAGLVLADTRAGVDDSQGKAARDASITTVREKGTAALFEGMLPKIVSDSTRGEKPQVVEQLKGIAAKQPPAGVAAALAAMRDRADANAGLKAISVPTLVIVGENDAVTPPLAAANLAAQIPGSKLVHIPNAGHLANIENADAFNAALREFIGERGA